MTRQVVEPSQEIADEHTLIAQRFAGYLVGHPFHNIQQSTFITVEKDKEWKEPGIVADDCVFCARLTDAEAERRVLGYQWQLDIESTRTKGHHLSEWVRSGDPEVPEPETPLWAHSAVNLRAFVERFQNVPTERRPQGWRTRPLPMVQLPLRLKRKLCIEWNHLYVQWMEKEGLAYDFDTHEFYREVPDEGGC